MGIAGITVGGEITDTLELQIGQWLHRGGERLHIAVLEDVERIGVDDLLHGGHGITVLRITDGGHVVTGILNLPQTVIETLFCLYSMGSTDPMERLSLDLTVGTWQTAA